MTEQPYSNRLAAINAVGKRLSTDDPLTPHDVAERLDKAALRLLWIVTDVQNLGPEFEAQVRGSRYFTNATALLRDALIRFLGDADA